MPAEAGLNAGKGYANRSFRGTDFRGNYPAYGERRFVILDYVSVEERDGSVVSVAANFLLWSAWVAIPSEVRWSDLAFGVVFVIGVAVVFWSGDWQRAGGLDKLVLFGPAFYAAPLAAFGTEHLTLTPLIASLVPKWMPWHMFWAYFVGVCFIAAALSFVTRIKTELAASLVGLTFFLFVILMDVPAWFHRPDRFVLALVLRELSFSGGALALAATWMKPSRNGCEKTLATLARYFIAIAVLYYSVELYLHSDHVPGIPLELVTPSYIHAPQLWTRLAALIYVVAGVPLLLGKRPRLAATWIGLAVLAVILAVYTPMAIIERASLEKGVNYPFDTLMFCGAVLLLAGAMPRESQNDNEPRAT